MGIGGRESKVEEEREMQSCGLEMVYAICTVLGFVVVVCLAWSVFSALYDLSQLKKALAKQKRRRF